VSKRHRGGHFKNKRVAAEIIKENWLGSVPTQAHGDEMVSDDDAAKALAQNHPKSFRPRSYGMATDSGSEGCEQPPDTSAARPGIGVGGAKPIGAFLS
jgi:hypothetical protein